MTVYEIAYITETEGKDLQKKVESIISEHKGSVTQKTEWGERPFAYRINNLTKGFYHIWNFTMEPGELSEFKKRLNIEDGVIRYLILKVD